MKECNRCNKIKAPEAFCLTPAGNLRGTCKACRKGEHLEKRYNLTLEDFDRMVEEQDGKCAICDKKEPLHVDHNHDTNEVRGLLCGNCNRGLGYLGDSRKNMLAAFNYLQEHGSYGE